MILCPSEPRITQLTLFLREEEIELARTLYICVSYVQSDNVLTTLGSIRFGPNPHTYAWQNAYISSYAANCNHPAVIFTLWLSLSESLLYALCRGLPNCRRARRSDTGPSQSLGPVEYKFTTCWLIPSQSGWLSDPPPWAKALWHVTKFGQLKRFKRCSQFTGRIVLNWMTVVSVLIFSENLSSLTILSAGELVDNWESVYHVPIKHYLHTHYFSTTSDANSMRLWTLGAIKTRWCRNCGPGSQPRDHCNCNERQ